MIDVVAQFAVAAAATPAWLHVPRSIPGQLDVISACDKMGPLPAMLLVGAGTVYLMFGLSFYKWLVTLNAAIVGAVAGALIGKHMGGALPGAILGGFCAAAVTWPLMKWAVAIMGGLFGAIIGAVLWRGAGLDLNFIWAGAMMGLITCGLLCFIVFKGSVMTYTSLQGAVMLVVGLLALICNYPSVATKVLSSLNSKPFLLPMAIFIPTVIGLMYQQSGAKPAGPPAKKA